MNEDLNPVFGLRCFGCLLWHYVKNRILLALIRT